MTVSKATVCTLFLTLKFQRKTKIVHKKIETVATHCICKNDYKELDYKDVMSVKINIRRTTMHNQENK